MTTEQKINVNDPNDITWKVEGVADTDGRMSLSYK
jgi:hypothetical protein